MSDYLDRRVYKGESLHESLMQIAINLRCSAKFSRSLCGLPRWQPEAVKCRACPLPVVEKIIKNIFAKSESTYIDISASRDQVTNDFTLTVIGCIMKQHSSIHVLVDLNVLEK